MAVIHVIYSFAALYLVHIVSSSDACSADILILFLNQDPNLTICSLTRQKGVPLVGLLVWIFIHKNLKYLLILKHPAMCIKFTSSHYHQVFYSCSHLVQKQVSTYMMLLKMVFTS